MKNKFFQTSLMYSFMAITSPLSAIVEISVFDLVLHIFI